MTIRFCFFCLLMCAACTQKWTKPIVPLAPSDNSYLDLTAGSKLRILVPLLKDGQTPLAFGAVQSAGSTITLSAGNLLGYELAYYSAEQRRNGKVRLRFASDEISKDGKTIPQAMAPKLPFRLPEKSAFIRLVFLVRVSEADHNMAIIAANSRSELDAFTRQLRQNPQKCQITQTVFCVSVPEGIAVRPESPGDVKR